MSSQMGPSDPKADPDSSLGFVCNAAPLAIKHGSFKIDYHVQLKLISHSWGIFHQAKWDFRQIGNDENKQSQESGFSRNRTEANSTVAHPLI